MHPILVRVDGLESNDFIQINIYSIYTCDKQVLWESAGAFFSARQLSFQHATRTVQAFVV